ncbi:hypothetical protein QCA50_003617 [Cerrena zonata]|uniref:Uncharacterized protein n=1 Tax=Cerrena zonata TaxID=2478898 RepID=A0AAW0GKT1_9APHY
MDQVLLLRSTRRGVTSRKGTRTRLERELKRVLGKPLITIALVSEERELVSKVPKIKKSEMDLYSSRRTVGMCSVSISSWTKPRVEGKRGLDTDSGARKRQQLEKASEREG